MNTARIATVTVPLSLMMAAVCFAENPHIGTWKFNEAKSKMGPGVTKNSTMTYSEQGDKIKATADGTDADGKAIHGVWVGKFDGKAYSVKGNPYHNGESYRVINDHTLFIEGLKDGKVMWWGTITISKDGKTRTATLHSTDAKGKKLTVKKVYDRV
jgi:uncharacterized protein (DUF2147 family)